MGIQVITLKEGQSASAQTDGIMIFVPSSEITERAEASQGIKVTNVDDFIDAVKREIVRDFYDESGEEFTFPIGQFMDDAIDVAVNEENCRGFEEVRSIHHHHLEEVLRLPYFGPAGQS